MLTKTVEVRNSTGLHARPAACLAKAAKKYSCKVTLHYEGNDINATSMMNIMRAGIKGGKTVEIRCDGVKIKTRPYRLSPPYFATASVKLNN